MPRAKTSNAKNNPRKRRYQLKYIDQLVNRFRYFLEQELSTDGLFQEIIEAILTTTHHHPELIDSALFYLDQVLQLSLAKYHFQLLVQHSRLLVDLLNVINLSIKESPVVQIDEKKAPFELHKVNPIASLMCCMFTYAVHEEDRQ